MRWLLAFAALCGCVTTGARAPPRTSYDFGLAAAPVPVPKPLHGSLAIADVAAYVLPDSALDREAQHRGTSVYFPNRVLPMLPAWLRVMPVSAKPSMPTRHRAELIQCQR